MKFRDIWDVIGLRGALAALLFAAAIILGIYGVMTDGWLTGSGIFLGLLSTASIVLGLHKIWGIGIFFTTLLSAITFAGFGVYISDSTQYRQKGTAHLEQAFRECHQLHSSTCFDHLDSYICNTVKSHEALTRAALSMQINLHTPKEVSSLVDLQAQRSLDLSSSACPP